LTTKDLKSTKKEVIVTAKACPERSRRNAKDAKKCRGGFQTRPDFVAIAIFVVRKCFGAWRTTFYVIFALSAAEPPL